MKDKPLFRTSKKFGSLLFILAFNLTVVAVFYAKDLTWSPLLIVSNVWFYFMYVWNSRIFIMYPEKVIIKSPYRFYNKEISIEYKDVDYLRVTSQISVKGTPDSTFVAKLHSGQKQKLTIYWNGFNVQERTKIEELLNRANVQFHYRQGNRMRYSDSEMWIPLKRNFY